MDIQTYCPRVALDDEGLWSAPRAVGVSYPADGHASYLAVEDGSFWFRHRNRCLLAVMERFPPPGPLFDVGGGNGAVARALAAAGREVVLIEPGREGARNARRRGVDPVVHATLEQAGVRPSSLPSVGLFDVVEHLPDDRAFLSDLRALLVPGGTTYLTVPAHPWLWSHEDSAAGHFRRYTRRALRGVLEQSGLEVLYVTPFFAALVPAIALMRALPFRLGRRQVAAPADDHAGVGARLIGSLLAPEVPLIGAGRALPFGASLLAVARRPR